MFYHIHSSICKWLKLQLFKFKSNQPSSYILALPAMFMFSLQTYPPLSVYKQLFDACTLRALDNCNMQTVAVKLFREILYLKNCNFLVW